MRDVREQEPWGRRFCLEDALCLTRWRCLKEPPAVGAEPGGSPIPVVERGVGLRGEKIWKVAVNLRGVPTQLEQRQLRKHRDTDLGKSYRSFTD